jgi:eukaryotic-like serine/threonine-protein kinase
MPSTITLAIIRGPLTGTEFVFSERTTIILGRAADCRPRLPDDEHHRTVSRHHCLIDINPPTSRVRDFGSLNGTYLNRVRIGQRDQLDPPPGHMVGAFPEHDLVDGDEIRLGSTVFTVRVRHTPPPGRQGAPNTKILPRCAQCGRDLDAPLDGWIGEQVCPDCRSDIDTLAKRLLDRADHDELGLASIAGHTLVRELGRGGMGRVYLARHTATDEYFALKMMLPAIAASTEAKTRFLREIEITKALRHPHIAALRAAGSSGGVFFFTTEYCRGGSLQQLIADRGGKLGVSEALPLALQALEALDYAHEQGVVHRDLTPQNILLTDHTPRRVKLADFGLAKAFDLAGLSGLTRTGTAAGKPYFLPYQQIVNFRSAGPPVDVWALAACLYYMLTGTYPRSFPADKDPWQVVLQTPPVPIRRREPTLPAQLAHIIDTALRDWPDIGSTSARDLHQTLQAHSQ